MEFETKIMQLHAKRHEMVLCEFVRHWEGEARESSGHSGGSCCPSSCTHGGGGKKPHANTM